MLSTDKLVTTSERVKTDDLDRELAARAGISDDEAFVLTYFADIEAQTISEGQGRGDPPGRVLLRPAGSRW
jgi:hypothetical protein